jgi:ABC-2 type transport system ATP-binding protein
VARHVLWDHLRELRKGPRLAVLLTTHDMEEAEVLCNRIVLLHAGRIAACGSPEELKAGVGPGATLNDVFVHYSGESIEAGDYRTVRQTRRTASRLG